MRLLVAVAVAGTLAGCAETPAQGFEAFYAAIASGSDDAVLRLSTRARVAFTGAARAAGKEPGPFLAGAVPKTTVRSVTVAEERGDAAVVEVKDALGNVERVQMLRENGRWLVDLSP